MRLTGISRNLIQNNLSAGQIVRVGNANNCECFSEKIRRRKGENERRNRAVRKRENVAR